MLGGTRAASLEVPDAASLATGQGNQAGGVFITCGTLLEGTTGDPLVGWEKVYIYISHRIPGAGIYANIWGILMVNAMGIYIYVCICICVFLIYLFV